MSYEIYTEAVPFEVNDMDGDGGPQMVVSYFDHLAQVASLKNDFERMHKAVLFAEKCFNMISSGDGSACPDLGRRVLSIAGIEQSAPANCRQRLVLEGKPYPKSSCQVCGKFSPSWKECDQKLEK